MDIEADPNQCKAILPSFTSEGCKKKRRRSADSITMLVFYNSFVVFERTTGIITGNKKSDPKRTTLDHATRL